MQPSEVATETTDFLKGYLGPELFEELDPTIQKYLISFLESGICIDGDSAYEQVF